MAAFAGTRGDSWRGRSTPGRRQLWRIRQRGGERIARSGCHGGHLLQGPDRNGRPLPRMSHAHPGGPGEISRLSRHVSSTRGGKEGHWTSILRYDTAEHFPLEVASLVISKLLPTRNQPQ